MLHKIIKHVMQAYSHHDEQISFSFRFQAKASQCATEIPRKVCGNQVADIIKRLLELLTPPLCADTSSHLSGEGGGGGNGGGSDHTQAGAGALLLYLLIHTVLTLL